MDDLRVGLFLRAVRIRLGLRQQDVATRAGLSDATISRIERGDLGVTSFDALRRVASALEVRIEVVPRWRGGEADRIISGRHSALAESVARRLGLLGWELRPEVSFSIYGERGVIDLLAWHPAQDALLVIELKTEIVDVGELLGTLDRKRRLAPRVAADLGWRPLSTSVCVIVTEGRSNRRRVTEHAAVLRAALPGDGRRLRGWLLDPRGAVALLAFWPNRHHARTGPGWRAVKRVRMGPKARDRAQLSGAGEPATVSDG